MVYVFIINGILLFCPIIYGDLCLRFFRGTWYLFWRRCGRKAGWCWWELSVRGTTKIFSFQLELPVSEMWLTYCIRTNKVVGHVCSIPLKQGKLLCCFSLHFCQYLNCNWIVNLRTNRTKWTKIILNWDEKHIWRLRKSTYVVVNIFAGSY